MSKISDEIHRRFGDSHEIEYVSFGRSGCDKMRELADRVDTEMVELPRDRDGVPIHVGDMLRGCDAVLVNVFTIVEELRFDGRWEIDTTFGCITEPRLFVHDSPDSFERIADELDEMVDDAYSADDRCERLADLADRISKLSEKED